MGALLPFVHTICMYVYVHPTPKKHPICRNVVFSVFVFQCLHVIGLFDLIYSCIQVNVPPRGFVLSQICDFLFSFYPMALPQNNFNNNKDGTIWQSASSKVESSLVYLKFMWINGAPCFEACHKTVVFVLKGQEWGGRKIVTYFVFLSFANEQVSRNNIINKHYKTTIVEAFKLLR